MEDTMTSPHPRAAAAPRATATATAAALLNTRNHTPRAYSLPRAHATFAARTARATVVNRGRNTPPHTPVPLLPACPHTGDDNLLKPAHARP